jgi:hypothetical protein
MTRQAKRVCQWKMFLSKSMMTPKTKMSAKKYHHHHHHHHNHHHHHHLSPWIRSFDLFRHRRIAIVSWGVHDLFFLEVCS